MLMHKMAVHLVLTGKALMLDRVPLWKNGSGVSLPEDMVQKLLREFCQYGSQRRRRELLRREIITAARCSRKFIFEGAA